ncbi:MAG: TonB-dependent receptor domain-containing protein [Candidatus Cyclobacteriaceae bacterium M3_2C_046]
MIRISTLILSILQITYLAGFSQPGSGQPGAKSPTGSVKGLVLDQDVNQPLEYANIIVYKTSDSTMVDGTITDGQGVFALNQLSYGTYYLIANFIGYEKQTFSDLKINAQTPAVDLGTIKLGLASTQLNNVEITAERQRVEYQIDKKIINVSQDLMARGGSAASALENVPSVRVDIEGNVSLRGSSNFNVFIDGRPSVLKGSDALQQIPASAIDRIEIITNPSAKYDPDGVGGIINIIMKKNLKSGLNGIVNASAGVRDKYSADALLNYRTGKFNWFGGLNWNDQSFIMTRNLQRETIFDDRSEFIDTEMEGTMRRYGYDLKAGFDYFIDDRQTLTLSGNYGYFGFGNNSTARQKSYSSLGGEPEYVINVSNALREGDFYSLNFNYQHKFDDKGHELSALSFYAHNYNGEDTDFNDEYTTDSAWDLIDNQPFRIFSNEFGGSDEFRAQIDYTKPFEQGKLETGLQYRYDNDQEEFLFQEFDPELNQWISNPFFNNSNQFTRNIYAGYATFSNNLFGFDYQLGIRGEYTDRTVKEGQADQPYLIDRLDYFPSFHLTKNITTNDQIQAGYSRRINRPRGYYLEPFISYYNRNTYRQGNPQLEPEYVNSLELNYQHRFGVSFVSLESYFRETNNVFTRTQRLYDSEENIMMMEFVNLNREKTMGAELMINWEATDWLLINTSANFYKYQLEGNLNEQEVANQSNNYDFRLNSNLKITPTTRIQLTGMYNGPSATAQGERGDFYMLNAALRQDFWNGKLSATLQARDILGSMKFDVTSTQVNADGPDFKNFFQFQREPRIFSLALSYKINNFKSKDRSGTGEGGGIDMNMGDF